MGSRGPDELRLLGCHIRPESVYGAVGFAFDPLRVENHIEDPKKRYAFATPVKALMPNVNMFSSTPA